MEKGNKVWPPKSAFKNLKVEMDDDEIVQIKLMCKAPGCQSVDKPSTSSSGSGSF